MDWKSKAQQKRSSLLAAIPPRWRLNPSDISSYHHVRNVTNLIEQFLAPLEKQITAAPTTLILENVALLRWTALEVVEAFCHRAALAHQLVNCLAEIDFEAALKRAAELDQYVQQHGRTIGPLHGLPVSLKDRFHVAGLDSSCGYVSWLGSKKRGEDEGVLVKRLRSAGAVLYVKTNVPMSMLIGETTNNIIGSTINPYNRFANAGGAAGGEGALLALRGAPFGWGSDIAGSIRIPCAHNNLFGLRPTFGRLSASGIATSLPGLPVAGSVIGPMSADLSSLIHIMKWFLSCNAWQDDYEVVDLPWNDLAYTNVRNRTSRPEGNSGSLVFAVMRTDGHVTPHPPVQRAITTVTRALEQKGYEVIDWNPPSHADAADLLFAILGSTAGSAIREAVNASGEPPIAQISELFNDSTNSSSETSEFWQLCQSREKFRHNYHKYWMSTREITNTKRHVDGVILPIAPHTAGPEGTFTYFAYSAVASLLDYPVGCVPVTFANQSIDHEQVDYIPVSNKDAENWRLYDKTVYEGSPIGVQVMGQRYQEEKVLALMEAVQGALGGSS